MREEEKYSIRITRQCQVEHVLDDFSHKKINYNQATFKILDLISYHINAKNKILMDSISELKGLVSKDNEKYVSIDAIEKIISEIE